jgi:hypothetical protein
MPETLGFLILNAAGYSGAAGFTVFGITGGASFASIVGGSVLAGALYGANALLGTKPESTPQDGQITVREPRSARRRNYGFVKVGGALMFSEVSGGTRYQILAVNSGEIDSFFQHWFADKQASLDGDGRVTNMYADEHLVPYVLLYFKLGTRFDAAFPSAIAARPDLWTVFHQGKDIAAVMTATIQPEAKNFTKVYPGGAVPIYRGVIKASKVWDPRDPGQDKDNRDTWTWTENAVLIALDFHRHSDGMGLAVFDDVFFTPAAIAEDWNYAANLCDEVMALANGGTEARYRCAGGYELQAPPKQVLNAILATCDGETYQRTDGAIGIRVGRDVDPTVTITDQHILSYSNFVNGSSGGISQINVISAKYTDRDLDFQEADADPWRDETSIAVTGREETRSVDLAWVPSHSQARRLMKIAAHRFNPQWTGQIVTDMDGLRAWGERFVTLQIAELSIDDTFEITSFEVLPASMTCAIGVRSFSQSAYDWDADDEEGTAPNEPDPGGDDDPIDAPGSVIATPSSGSIAVTWGTSGRLDTTPELQYKLHASSTWLAGLVDTATSGHVSGIAAGTYDIQVRFNVGSRSSSLTGVINIVVP